MQLSLLIALLLSAVILAIRFKLISVYNADISGIEATSVIYFIQRVMADMPLYTDPQSPPFAIMSYTPLYYQLCGVVGKLLGIDPGEPIKVYVLSRSISLIINFLLLGWVFYLFKNFLKVGLAYSVILTLVSFIFMECHIFSRPDSLYMLFMTGTVIVTLYYTRQTEAKKQLLYIVMAGVLTALTIFSKQTGIFLPVVIVAFLIFLHPKFKHLVFYLLSLAVVMTGLTLMQGPFFATNVIQGINNGVDLWWFYNFIAHHFLREINMFIIPGVFLSFYFLGTRQNTEYKFMAAFLIISLVFSIGTSTKYGSGPNYFSEFILVSTFAMGAAFFSKDNIFSFSENTLQMRNLVMMISLAIILPMQTGAFIWEFNYAGDEKEYNEARDIKDYFYKDLVLKKDEWIWVYTHGWVDKGFGNTFLFKNTIMPNKDFYGCCIMPLNVLDMSQFHNGINNGLVKYLVMPHDWQSFNFAGTDVNRFELLKRFDKYAIFRYNPELPAKP